MFPSYRSQTNNLDYKSMNWFLCDGSIEGQAKSYPYETFSRIQRKKISAQPKDDCGFSWFITYFFHLSAVQVLDQSIRKSCFRQYSELCSWDVLLVCEILNFHKLRMIEKI